MTVTVIGKRKVDGVNPKTGKMRNGTVVHLTYEDERVEGLAVASKWVDSSKCLAEHICVGQRYYSEENDRYIIKFYPIPSEATNTNDNDSGVVPW